MANDTAAQFFARTREMLRQGTWSLREIGEAFGVAKSTISDIKHSRTWNDAGDDAAAANANAAGVTASTES